MGLFSSKEEPPSPVNRTISYSAPQYSGYAQRENIEQILRARKEDELRRQTLLIRQFEGLSISNSEQRDNTVSSLQPSVYKRDETIYSFQPSRVKVNSNLLYELLNNDGSYSCLNDNNIYNLVSLNEDSVEFYEIKNMFTRTNKKFFKVNNTVKIYNPYILAQYKLMEKCYKKRYGYTSIEQLFHGTRKGNIDNICKYNFNWRLKGTARGHIFGQGVSFTPISYYATHYGDKTFEKIMIVANVLVSNKCVGAQKTVIPPSNYDTTTKENEHVIVKYDDNTFYPAYIIYYQGIDTSKSKQHHRHFLM